MKRFWFFVLFTILVSWALWAPVVAARLHTTDTVAGAVLFFAGGFGPSLMGAIFVLRSGEGGGARELLSRTFSFSRIPILPLVLAGTVYPAFFLASALLTLAFGGSWPEFSGFTRMLESVQALAGGLVLIFLLGPLSEEIGWRGFALPLLQRQWGPLGASVIVGIVWWAWHIPLFYMEGTLHATQGLVSAFSIGYLVTVLSYSVFFTWLYNQTRASILIAIIAHFIINIMISGSSPFDGAVFAILSFLLLAAAVALALIRPRLGHETEHDSSTTRPAGERGVRAFRVDTEDRV